MPIKPYAFSSKPLGIHPDGGYLEKLASDNPRDYLTSRFPSLVQRKTYYQSQASRRNSGSKVRLRARQVLCNMCKSICSENGDKVEGNRKQKLDLVKVKKYSLVPKIKRLAPSEIKRLSSSESPDHQPSIKIRLSKSASADSKENQETPTPVLKISFGGEQTVMTIPPKARTGPGSKAARKAIKKAKKVANKVHMNQSPYASPLNFNSPFRSPTHSSFRVATPSYSASYDDVKGPTTVKLKKIKLKPKLSDHQSSQSVEDDIDNVFESALSCISPISTLN